ncbi:uncharacterized protein [Periplaneta americana]|uniref:uncharacterized protein n=1 Tax=Periplaneta americana TaxID=6978 RepID=UPI0037E8065C
MKVFLILSLALWAVFASDSSGQLNNIVQNKVPTENQPLGDINPFSKIFIGDFLPIGGPKKGESRVNLDGTLIANITIMEEWFIGNGTLEIEAGGIGYDYVVFNYDIPADSQLYFEIKIYSTEDIVRFDHSKTQEHDNTQISAKLKEQLLAEPEEIIRFIAYGDYSSNNKSRVETYSFSFDKTVHHCLGESSWYNGEGNTDVTGGISENYLQFTSHIPAQVTGFNSYKCYFVDGQYPVSSKKTNLAHYKLADVHPHGQKSSELSLCQWYSSITPTDELTIVSFGTSVILSYEGGPEWRNGTGNIIVNQGGVGSTFIGFIMDKDPYAFGSYKYNLILNETEPVVAVNRDWMSS